MPLYEYRCPKCGASKQDMRPVEARHDGPVCTRLHCHTQMELQLTAVRGFVKNPAVPRR